MKNLFKCFVAVAIMGLAALAAAQETVPSAENINPAILEVNGDTVYAAEISMVMRNIAGQFREGEQVPDNQQLLQMATQRVIEQKLLAQEARRFGVENDEAWVAQMLEAAEKQSGGREALEANLARIGSDYEHLTAMIVEMDLVRVFIEHKIVPTIEVSDEEVAAFYSQHPDAFATAEQVRARHIIFAAGEDADETITKKAREKAENARTRAVAGEDFAALAKELSEGPTASTGGDLGFFTREQMVPAFADAAFALEPGEISEVVRSPFGFHVIKVEEKRPAGTQSLEEATPRIRKILVQQKTAEAVGELLDSLGAEADIKQLVTESPASADAGSETVPE